MGTELDPGKASLFVVAEQGIEPEVMSQFQVGQMMATVAGSRDKTGRLRAADWGLWDVQAMLVFRTRI